MADDPQGTAALDRWLDQKDDLLAGCTPRVGKDDLTVKDLANRFLNNRRSKLDSGELAAVSFADYYATCERIVKAFGPSRLVADLDASDFERFRASMAKGWSAVTLANEIGRVRVVFRYATENQLVPSAIRYGSSFRKPSKKILRAAWATKRPRPKNDADKGLVFITKYGKPWGTRTVTEPKESGGKLKKNADDPVAKEFTKLLKALGFHRPGCSFYGLRHTFETIGGDARDQVAVDAIMGHARNDMASLYRGRVDDDRLRAVVRHVRKWLFQDTKTK